MYSKQLSDIQKRLKDNGFKSEKQYADAGFINGETLKESIDNETDFEGRSAGHSHSNKEHSFAN